MTIRVTNDGYLLISKPTERSSTPGNTHLAFPSTKSFALGIARCVRDVIHMVAQDCECEECDGIKHMTRGTPCSLP
jgi:hypothetical protein